ncbi:MAG TPA: hypothetical protein VJT74_05995 [Pyrinomonadaceae bacterium]|nr:hypothetical protein [Pyrinomonadaceae bacterium]
MSKVEESLRELVREELKGRAPAPPPDGKQIFWLFLCVANAVMLLWLLPETIFDNKRVENLSKFVVWLGGSVFISSFVWFREQLLVLSRKPLFKWAQLVALPLLTLLYLSQLSIFTIHPNIEPKDSELIVDGRNMSEDEREDLSLSLGEHKVVVQPAGWDPRKDSGQFPRPRRFRLTLSNVLSAWWGGAQPRWPLVYDVNVKASGAVDEVVVQNVGPEFDPVFASSPEPPLSPGEVSQPIVAPVVNQRELVYQWHGASDVRLPLRLPHGKYVLFSRKKGCADKLPVNVEVPEVERRTVELLEPCAQSQ